MCCIAFFILVGLSVLTTQFSSTGEPPRPKIYHFKPEGKFMIEVLNIHAINKGNVLATCDVRIIPWQLTFCEVVIFQKGSSRWIALPSKTFQGDLGEIKYKEMIKFDSDAVKNRFRSQIMGAIDKYLEENPTMEAPPVIKQAELPF